MYTIRVLLAEDHTIVRKGLRALLVDSTGIAVIAEAEDGREAVQLARKHHPDIVVMDISMPGLNGLEATRQIVAGFPDIKVLILTRHADETYVRSIMQAGASGYIVKKAAPSELVAAIQAVYQGETYLSSVVAHALNTISQRPATLSGESERFERLTPREREVLQLVVEGHPNRDIADVLHISIKTVESHKTSIFSKLGVHSTAELTQVAIRKGVISLE